MEDILESACVSGHGADRPRPVEKTGRLEDCRQPQAAHGSVVQQHHRSILHQGKLVDTPVHTAYSTSEYDAAKTVISNSPLDRNKLVWEPTDQYHLLGNGTRKWLPWKQQV